MTSARTQLRHAILQGHGVARLHEDDLLADVNDLLFDRVNPLTRFSNLSESAAKKALRRYHLKPTKRQIHDLAWLLSQIDPNTMDDAQMSYDAFVEVFGFPPLASSESHANAFNAAMSLV